MRQSRILLALVVVLLISTLLVPSVAAKNPIRTDFFDHYPSAVGTVLDATASNSKHCGVCHYDFNGGGPRNHYGQRVEYWRGQGLSNDQAFAQIEIEDSDGDGYENLTEITDTVNYPNTPTFPGLSSADLSSIANIPLAEISPYVTPTAAVDTTPPSVTVTSPTGTYDAGDTATVLWTATDTESGVAGIEIFHSDDGGANWKPIALALGNSGSFDWFVPNRPGTNNVIRVEALDAAGNLGTGDSPTFTINAQLGLAPTTLRDMDMPGTQPLEGPQLGDPDTNCATCHGNYDTAVEPWANWRGSMMSQAARDPIFYACLAIAEQDAPSVGDLCIRCHTPGGWLAGRSNDTSGGSLTADDRKGITCDFGHNLVDPNYVPGVSPAEDEAILSALAEIPAQSGNGQYVMAPSAPKRGPYADALETGHPITESPFHREAAICGTCHDVSSPVYDNLGGGDYALNGFDAPHATNVTHQMGSIERTFSEWANSEFAATGVNIPQYGGTVATCQDCHMQNVTGRGANDPAAPIRSDLPLHDFTGGNTFMPLLVAHAYPGEVDTAQLNAAIARAETTLTRAARIELTPDPAGLNVRVYNDTGHKLPSGYPEGRRIWLHVVARDETDAVVYESGAYDPATGILTHDADAKIYEIKPGLSPALAAALGLAAGPSFHFVLNDTVYADNRIPPRGFTNAAFEAIQSNPVAYTYADGQYWDDTFFALPNTAKTVTVELLYQATSKEYVEFLRDENTTNTAGQELYDMWVLYGKCPPEVMASATTTVDVVTAVDEPQTQFEFALGAAAPNPMADRSSFSFSIPAPGHISLAVYDVRGRKVRTIEDEIRPAGRYTVHFDGKDDRGATLASGVYFMRLEAAGRRATQRVTILR